MLRRAARRVIPRRVRQARARRLHPPWVQTLDEPQVAETLDDFEFHAIVGSWMEGDVIADTIGNVRAQGVDRVFVVDNHSPDDTVERAMGAGAEVIVTYESERYEEEYRIGLMNEVVRHVSRTSKANHVWWVWVDADEFPRAQGTESLRARLERLDRRYRVVGARFLNHYPTPGDPAYVPGRHPAEVQPLCEELRVPICSEGHRKHPLLRWDRDGPDISADLGFHRAVCQQRPLYEPSEPIVIHHVPFREEQLTRRRMDALWGADSMSGRALQGDIATDHMAARRRSLDAVYRGDWADIENFLPDQGERGVDLKEWTRLEPEISPVVVRWSSD